ncbi:MAG: hypothetical protein GY820_16915 [Gammaproteobacteria bacterium]|nr:hypothetical protein [Gammaproteobacteria bacterium]
MSLAEAYATLLIAMHDRRRHIEQFSEGPGGAIAKIKLEVWDEAQALVRHHIGEVIKNDD